MEENEMVNKICSLEFLEFLFNVINPNEMQNYIDMYFSTNEKTLT